MTTAGLPNETAAGIMPDAQERRPRERVMATVEEAIAEYQAGRFVIIIDNEDRENEGDLTIAAQFVTAEHINFMARYGRGLICMPITAERVEQLGIPMMVDANSSHFGKIGRASW